jgi:hypothetical protein
VVASRRRLALNSLLPTTPGCLQFIEEFDITQGPHDMSELLPFCRDLNVDDSIIYLYSILPYVKGGGDFVCRGAKLDLRDKSDIEQARSPMYANDDEAPRPWMTGLSSIANHDTTLVYDARRHVIGMYCQEGFDSTDRNLHDQTPSISRDEDVDDTDASVGKGQGTPDAADKSDKEDNDDDTEMTDTESHTEEGSASEQWVDEWSDVENLTDERILGTRWRPIQLPRCCAISSAGTRN